MIADLPHDVIIVGAGPAGIGCALALQACGIQAVLLDARGAGSSFASWPRQMRLLTPSFHSNAFGYADLNAVTPQTSPADFLRTQHPTGAEYARYLQALAQHYQLDIRAPVRVRRVLPQPGGGFVLHTARGALRSRFVIWATGEFSTPDTGGIQGAGLCRHNSQVEDWTDEGQPGQSIAVIGGNESGVDAAIHLLMAGSQVHLFSRGEPWSSESPDPSESLSPHTRDRLREALLKAPGRLTFHKQTSIHRVQKTASGYRLESDMGELFASDLRPVLCTGFCSALESQKHLWSWQKGQPVFSEEADESTLTPGLFYSGPSLQHHGMLFCFIYKYRSRFGVVARAIARRLGCEWEAPLRLWQTRGFLMDDLSCCTDCQCAVESEESAELYESPPHAATV